MHLLRAYKHEEYQYSANNSTHCTVDLSKGNLNTVQHNR